MNARALAEGLHPYLLEPIPTERERLALQASMWEPAAERLFDALGPIDGWSCVDLGCGAPGVLGTLARRVGSTAACSASTAIASCSSMRKPGRVARA